MTNITKRLQKPTKISDSNHTPRIWAFFSNWIRKISKIFQKHGITANKFSILLELYKNHTRKKRTQNDVWKTRLIFHFFIRLSKHIIILSWSVKKVKLPGTLLNVFGWVKNVKYYWQDLKFPLICLLGNPYWVWTL